MTALKSDLFSHKHMPLQLKLENSTILSQLAQVKNAPFMIES